MTLFKFLTKNEYYTLSLPLIRRVSARPIAADLVPVQPLGSPDNARRIIDNATYGRPSAPIRQCAVIAASIRDFNSWKRSIFDMAHVQMITSGEFIHTNGNNNVSTRYRAICYVQDCFGQMFNDYVITDRTNEILMRDYHDDYIINHINELINEVQRHTRR